MRSTFLPPGGQVIRQTSASIYNQFRERPLVSNSTIPLISVRTCRVTIENLVVRHHCVSYPHLPSPAPLLTMISLLRCKTCGKDQTAPGVKLRKCSKCRGSAYCGKRQSSRSLYLRCRRVILEGLIVNGRIGLRTGNSAGTGMISTANAETAQNTKGSWS